MEKMFKVNDFGLLNEIGIVASTLYDNIPCVIYTDFISDEKGDLRLYVGRLGSKKEIYDVPIEVSKAVLKDFHEAESEYLKEIREEDK